jgi:RNA polymerase sigma factor (sigma-70 family)
MLCPKPFGGRDRTRRHLSPQATIPSCWSHLCLDVILSQRNCEVYVVSSTPPVDTVESGSTARRSRGEGFEAFYLEEYPRLLALARGLVGASQAEDVAQDALLVACHRWREISQKERPDLWVRRICSNMAVSTFRRRIRDARALARLSARRSEAVTMPESSEQFWKAVRALPARQAQAAALRFVYDMPLDEIARTMQCSTGTVKQHLSRARMALTVTLAAEEADT